MAKQKTELDVSPERLHELLTGAAYYLGSRNLERAQSIGSKREVNRIIGALNEWADELEEKIKRGDV